MRLGNGFRGMTLIELLVVMSIIGLMAAMLGLVVPAAGRKMNESKTKANIQKLTALLQMYYDDCNQYPDAINHNPQRTADTITGLCAVPPTEPDGQYPFTNKTGNRRLYMSHYEETLSRTTEEKDRRQLTELVWTLCSTLKGWGRPQFWETFTQRDLNSTGQLVDGWGRRLFYLPACAYRRGTPTSVPPGGGSVMILKGAGKGPFQNTNSFQIYSPGENLCTPLDSDNKGGSEPDDITNWASITD